MLPAHRNPFRTSRLDRLGFRFPEGWDMPRLLGRLDALGGRGAIVGPPGSGKTTLLAELARTLEAQGLEVLRLRVGHPCDPPLRNAIRAISRSGRHAAVLVDAGRGLGPFARGRIGRAGRHVRFLVLAAHRPHPFPTLIRLAATPELLRELLIELDPGAEPEPRETLENLCRRHHGDLHAVFLELFDRASGRW